MVEALEENFGSSSQFAWGDQGCEFSRPDGGMFVWVELPDAIDTMRLVERTVAEHQVAFIPGVAFAESGTRQSNALRFSFSTLSPDQIRQAVAVVAKTASSML